MPNLRQRSYQAELMDDLNLAEEALRQNLDELERINQWLGGNAVVRNALNRLLRQKRLKAEQSIRIADLGAGGGDNLRMMANWAKKKGIEVEFTGIDANQFMIDYAQQRASNYPNIHFQKADVFAPDFRLHNYQVITLSLFCHHFPEKALSQLFRQLKTNNPHSIIIINDLHRHILAYWGIKLLIRLFGGSYLLRHDAPLSVWRAFKARELRQILEEAGIKNAQIRWKWAFRYQVIF